MQNRWSALQSPIPQLIWWDSCSGWNLLFQHRIHLRVQGMVQTSMVAVDKLHHCKWPAVCHLNLSVLTVACPRDSHHTLKHCANCLDKACMSDTQVHLGALCVGIWGHDGTCGHWTFLFVSHQVCRFAWECHQWIQKHCSLVPLSLQLICNRLRDSSTVGPHWITNEQTCDVHHWACCSQ